MADSLRVLIVEDSVQDTFFILRELSREFQVTSERVTNGPEMRAALEAQAWDLVISDYAMPGFGGRQALEIFQHYHLEIPFIMVSGVMGEAIAVEMVKSGAHNYVMKNQLERLVPAVRQELRSAAQRRGHQETEAATAYIASLVESCDDAIISTTLSGVIASWNAGAQRLFGYTSTEMLGRTFAGLVPPYRPNDWSEVLQKISVGGHVESRETQWLRKDGTAVDVSLTFSAVRGASGNITAISIVAHDITSRKLDEKDRLELLQELTAALAHTSAGKAQTGAPRTSSSR